MTLKHAIKINFRRVISILLLLSFVSGQILPPSIASAQTASVLNLPMPGAMVGISPSYVPIAIKGIKIFPDNPFRFDFLLDTGNSKLSKERLNEETKLLIKYFLTALTIPDQDQWVNLSPYEHERIVPNEFGITEMGRDLLAQDYLLKQLTASLVYPEHELGKKFWDTVYKKAYEKYGDVDIPVSTFNKVWIMPEHAKVYEHGTTAVITESHLKVMLEEDYLAFLKSRTSSPDEVVRVEANKDNAFGADIVREIVLPSIEKEINEGKNFAKLRQVYQSMILAAWFKRKLKDSILNKMYVGKNKVAGVDVEDKQIKQKIYEQYLDAYKKGVYNYVREDVNERTQEIIPRKYFSGGVVAGAEVDKMTQILPATAEQLSEAAGNLVGESLTASVGLEMAGQDSRGVSIGVENAPSGRLDESIPMEAREKILNQVHSLIDIVKAIQKTEFDRGGSNYQYKLFVDEKENKSLPEQFRRLLGETKNQDEIRFLAHNLNDEWKRNGFDRDLGSVFEYVAYAFSEYTGTPAEIKKSYDWLYTFLDAGSPLQRVYALRLLVVGFINHMRRNGFHPESDAGKPRLSDDAFPMDIELLIGNERELRGKQIFQRYILGLLELQETGQWTEIIGSVDGQSNKLGLTNEDMLLWALALLVDPTIYYDGVDNYSNEQINAYLSKYFGEEVNDQNSGIKFLLRALSHESLKDKLSQIEALLMKAFAVSEQQWGKKGQRSPFSFAYQMDNLKSVLTGTSMWDNKSARILGDPMLMLGFDFSYWSKESAFMLKPAKDSNRHPVLMKQGEQGLRPLYIKTFTSPELSAMFPNLARTLSGQSVENSFNKVSVETIQAEDLKISDERKKELDSTADYFMRSFLDVTTSLIFKRKDFYEAGFVRDLRRLTDIDEIRYVARNLNTQWQKAGLDKQFGPFFTAIAVNYGEEQGETPAEVRNTYEWIYKFLEAAGPVERAEALWAMVVSNNAHLRRLGLHPEVNGTEFLDQELLLGKEPTEKALLARFVESMLALTPEQLAERINSPEGSDFTREDLMLWGLLLAVDPTTYAHSLEFKDDQLDDFLAKYFGDKTDRQTAAIKFLLRGFKMEEFRDKLPQVDALLTKAFSITDDQWAVKGLRSPFWFGLPYVQLTAMFKTSDGAAAIASAQLDNPFLAYAVDLKFFSETVVGRYLSVYYPDNPGLNAILSQFPDGRRESYAATYTSPELSGVFLNLAAALRGDAGLSGGGALKDIGVYDGGNGLKVSDATLAIWKARASPMEVQTQTIAGQTITAKVIEAEPSEMPEKMWAYWLKEDNGTLVIVLSGEINRGPLEIREEAVFHEAREAFWFDVLKTERAIPIHPFSPDEILLMMRDSHILATADQIFKFGQNSLTPYHEFRIGLLSKSTLNSLRKESREYHYDLVQPYLTKTEYERYRAYDLKFQERLSDATKGWRHSEFNLSGQDREFLKNILSDAVIDRYQSDLAYILQLTGRKKDSFKQKLLSAKNKFNEDFDKYFPGLIVLAQSAGDEWTAIFTDLLPGLRETFGDELERYWPDLIELGKGIGGENIIPVLVYGFSAVRDLVHNEVELRSVGQSLIELSRLQDSNWKPQRFFTIAIPAVRQLFGNDFQKYWPDLVELGLLGGNPGWLFYYGLQSLKTLFGYNFNEYLPILIRLGKQAGKGQQLVFKFGLHEFPNLIKNANALESVGLILIELYNSSERPYLLFARALPKVRQYIKKPEDLRVYAGLSEKLAQSAENYNDIIIRSIPNLRLNLDDSSELLLYGEVLRDLAKSAGADAEKILIKSLPAFRRLFKTPEDLRAYGNVLININRAAGENAYIVIPGLQNFLKVIENPDDVRLYGEALIYLTDLLGNNAYTIVTSGLANSWEAVKSPEDLKRYAGELAALDKTLGAHSQSVYKHIMPNIWKHIQDPEDLKKYGEVLASLGDRSGEFAAILFEYGLPSVDALTKSPDDIDLYGARLINLANSSAKDEVEALFVYGLGSVKFLVKNSDDLERIGKILLNIGNKYNRKFIYRLFTRFEIFDFLNQKQADLNSHFEFYVLILNQNPRLGLKILEGLFEAVKSGLVDLSLKDKESILAFIKSTKGFEINLYRLFLKEGEGGLARALSLKGSILNDELSHDDILAKEVSFSNEGYNGEDLVLATILSAIPSSGASFVQKQNVKGLFKKMRAAGDLRGHVPEALRNLAYFGGKDFHRVAYVLKDGEAFDADGKIKSLVGDLQYPDQGKTEEQVADDMAADKNEVFRALERYLLDQTSENSEAVLKAFYYFVRHNDLLKEKIDAIQMDYVGINFLEQLFYDKNNLSALLKELVEELRDERPELLEITGRQPVTDVNGFVKAIRPILRISIAEKREEALFSFLRKYDAESLSNTTFPDDVKAAISEVSQGRDMIFELSVNKVVKDILEQPLKVIAAEKQKFAEVLTDEPIRLRFRAVKGIPYGLWGLLAGVCIAPDVKLWEKPQFYLLAMIDEQTQQAVGFIHMFEHEVDGRKVLTVPGIEPSVEFLGHVSGKEIYPLVVDALRRVAQEVGYAAVYLPTSENILSNRSEINEIVKRGQYSTTRITLVDWNTIPRPYQFTTVYELPNEHSGATVKGESDNLYGALKNISIFIDEDAGLKVPAAVLEGFKTRAALLAVSNTTIPVTGGQTAIVPAKIIEAAEGELPEQMAAYWFKDDNGNLVVVLSQEINKGPPAIKEEAIFHEARESYWSDTLRNERFPGSQTISDKDLEKLKRDVHILAAAEESIAFSQNGTRITPYNKGQIENLSGQQRGEMINEDREQNHLVILAGLGPDKLDEYARYEDMFRAELKRIDVEVLHRDRGEQEFSLELPSARFGAAVDLGRLMEEAAVEVLGYVPLFLVFGSYTYIRTPNGSVDWDHVGDLDIRIHARKSLSFQQYIDFKTKLFEKLGQEKGLIVDSPGIDDPQKRGDAQLYWGIRDIKTNNSLVLNIQMGNLDDVFAGTGSFMSYRVTDRFLGDLSELKALTNDLSERDMVENTVQFYLETVRELKSEIREPYTLKSVLGKLKTFYQLAVMRGKEEEYRWLIDELDRFSDQLKRKAFDPVDFGRVTARAFQGLDVDEQTVAADITRVFREKIPGVAANTPGGIDMNQKTLNLQVEGETIKFDMPFDPAQWENIKLDGFTPVILQINTTNLPLFIGANETDNAIQLSSV